MMAQALEAVKGNVENQPAFLAALKKVDVDAPRGKVRLDAYHNPIHTIYMRKVERKDGALQNTVIATYPGVNQFWKWTPEQYMAMPPYAKLKGQWVK
jgi:branched-chain amino acid transport system substrate-binding protein